MVLWLYMGVSAVKKSIQRMFASYGHRIVPRQTIAMDYRQMRHFLCLADLFEHIQNVPGSVVECGVGRGRSFLQFAFLITQEAKKRALWGFDSFEGFPTPAVEDMSVRNPKKGEWSGTSPDDIREVLTTAGISAEFMSESVHLIPGFFEDTLSQYTGDPIAFLHIDTDLYESYKLPLATLVPLVSKGGVVMFDEYGHEKWPGATKAVDEFLVGTNWKLEKHEKGDRYYFIKD